MVKVQAPDHYSVRSRAVAEGSSLIGEAAPALAPLSRHFFGSSADGQP
jgi:hypothetical protein